MDGRANRYLRAVERRRAGPVSWVCGRWKPRPAAAVVVAVVGAAVALALIVSAVATAPAWAGNGGGDGGDGGASIWATSWWAGSPEGPGPDLGGPAGGGGVCIWQDAGATLAEVNAVLAEAGLPASFWTVARGGGHHGIWGVDLWAAASLQSGPPGAHVDLVACSEGDEVPPNGGEVESNLPAVDEPSGRPMHLWLFFDTVPDPPAGDLPPLIGEAWSSARLPRPEIATSPSSIDGVADSTVVNFSTWLWIDPSSWHLVAATAAGGGYVATVWAVPIGLTWHADWSLPSPSDDPEHGVTLRPEQLSLECNGPGAPYEASRPAAVGSACTATFDQSTFGTVQALAATVAWQVHWAWSDAAGVVGGEGTLPDAVTVGTRGLRVLQVESEVASG